MNMTLLERLHELARDLLTEKEHDFAILKQKVLDHLDEVDARQNGEIRTLWLELKGIHQQMDQHQKAPSNPDDPPKTTKAPTPRKRRGRKRKKNETKSPTNVSADVLSADREPPMKRRRSSGNEHLAQTVGSNQQADSEGNAARAFAFDADHKESTTNTKLSRADEERFVRRMLSAAESALQLHDLNMDALQKCIDAIDESKDSLDADVMALEDEMRRTTPRFPTGHITQSFHQKILREQKRMKQLAERFPALELTERDILRIHSRFVSRYHDDPGSEGDDLLVFGGGDDGGGGGVPKEGDRGVDGDIDGGAEEESESKEDVETDSDSAHNLWCHCRTPSMGKMIRCDNKRCKIKWFHWKCCNLSRAPNGKWFCKKCRRWPSKSNMLHTKFKDLDINRE